MAAVPVSESQQQIDGEEERSPRQVLADVMSLVCEQAPFELSRGHDHEADRHRRATQTREEPGQAPRRPVEQEQAVPEARPLEREEPEHQSEERVRQRPDEPEPDGHGRTVTRR